MRTGYDGRAIRLTVPASWLHDAVYPVTVDPLVGLVGIKAGRGIAIVERPELVSVRLATRSNLLVVHARPFSSKDWDCWAIVYDSGFKNPRTIYADLSSQWSTIDCAASFVGATRRWVIVHDRQGIGSTKGSFIQVYLHDLGNAVFGSGKKVGFGTYSGSVRRPDVGGTVDVSTAGDNALVVFESHSTTGRVEAIGALVNSRTPRSPTYFLVAKTSVGTSYDPNARATTYGVGCGGKTRAPQRPDAGFEYFTVNLDQALPGKLVWLMASFSSAATPLNAIGMPGCYLNVGPALFVPSLTNGAGSAFFPIALPDAPLFRGNLYLQWVHLGATPLGLVSTQGLKVEVR